MIKYMQANQFMLSFFPSHLSLHTTHSIHTHKLEHPSARKFNAILNSSNSV